MIDIEYRSWFSITSIHCGIYVYAAKRSKAKYRIIIKSLAIQNI